MKNNINDAECCKNCANMDNAYERFYCHADKTTMPDYRVSMTQFLKWAEEHEVRPYAACDEFEIMF